MSQKPLHNLAVRTTKTYQKVGNSIFIPLTLYTIAVIYGVIYLSILNTVNRGKGMDAIKTWYGGDRPEIVKALKEEKEYLGNSFKKMIRKRVSGGR